VTAARPMTGWRSGFCSSYPHADWQRAACHGGHSRTPTKADPRDWVPCVCECHQPEETPVTVPIVESDQPTPEPAPATLPVAAELVALAAEKLSRAATGTIEGLDWEDCVRLLDLLRDATHAIGQVDSLLVRRAYLAGPHGTVEVDGIGVVGIHRGKDRKDWDHLSLATAVVDAHLEERAARGEHEAPPPWEVVNWITEAAGFNYWRVTIVRDKLGIPVSDFVEEKTGNLTVQLPPRS
jgi:hypothetical protein